MFPGSVLTATDEPEAHCEQPDANRFWSHITWWGTLPEVHHPGTNNRTPVGREHQRQVVDLSLVHSPGCLFAACVEAFGAAPIAVAEQAVDQIVVPGLGVDIPNLEPSVIVPQ